jgi:hypothetical protein
MNAQIQSTNITQALASEVTDKDIPDWLLVPGFLMSVSGTILLALGNWTLLNPMTRTLLLLCGAILCFLGIILIPSWLIYRTKEASARQTIRGDDALPPALSSRTAPIHHDKRRVWLSNAGVVGPARLST